MKDFEKGGAKERAGGTAPASEERPGVIMTFRGKLALMMAGLAFCSLAVLASVMFVASVSLLNKVNDVDCRLITANSAALVHGHLSRWERILVDEDARLTVQRDFAPEKLATTFRGIVEEYSADSDIYDIYFVDAATGILSSGRGYVQDPDIDFTSREFYAGAVRIRGSFFTPPYVDVDTNRPVITIARAVHVDGRIAGVLATDIFVDTIARMTRSQMMPESSYCFIIDENGIVIHHPDKETFGPGVRKRLDDCGLSGYHKVADLIEREHSGKAGEHVSLEDYDGATRRFHARHMPGSPWHTVAAFDEGTLGRNLDMLNETFLMACAAAIIFTVIGAYLAATSMTYTINGILERTIGDGTDPELMRRWK